MYRDKHLQNEKHWAYLYFFESWGQNTRSANVPEADKVQDHSNHCMAKLGLKLLTFEFVVQISTHYVTTCPKHNKMIKHNTVD